MSSGGGEAVEVEGDAIGLPAEAEEIGVWAVAVEKIGVGVVAAENVGVFAVAAG